MVQEIYIIDDDDSSIVIFRELFRNDPEYKFISVKTEQIDIALKNIPSLIVINEDAIDRDVVELCRKIRKDEDNTITPVIEVSSKSEKEHRVRILQESIEYFIKKPVDEQYLYYTVKNLNRLLSSNRRVSPLTGLPGNVQIHAELKKRILRQEPFCVLYVDLDNFKAYNDVYGFLKGDEIIEFTAETIIKMVHSDELENTFVGHIGGDDFVAIVPGTNCEKLCQNIISYFDKNVERYFTEADIEKGYIEVANRKGIIEQVNRSNSGHPGGSLSIADILTVLYFNELNIDEKNPKWEDRDRMILSKGHCSPALYSCLANRGFFDKEELKKFRNINSRLQGHPDMNKVPGVDMTTGSLGQGLSVANGMAIAGKLNKKDYRVYCVLGDGEIEEGQIWEAAMASNKYKLDNLCVIVDNNNLQIDGTIEEVMSSYPIEEKFRSFGFQIININGHDIEEIIKAFDVARNIKEKPTCIIAKTIKGKGKSFMENQVGWHGKAPNEEQYIQAMKELET